jgi:putative ABC transport system permease protein
MIGAIKKDLGYAVRMIVRTPVVSLIAILSLAIGVSVNTTIFSVLHSWLLRPLPYEQPEGLVMLYENNRHDANDTDRVTPANYFDWMDQAGSFQNIAATRFAFANLTGLERPEQLRISVVTPNFFGILRTEAIVGRTFLPGEGHSGDRVTVLGESLWRTRFGADPSVVGTTLRLDGSIYTIVGIIPERFDFILGSVSAWTASDFDDVRSDRTNRSLTVVARLRDGVDILQARAELVATAARLETLHPESNQDWSANVQSVRTVFPGPTDRGLINIMMVVGLLVLLVACANIASLLMAKTETRQKELAIRTALGASKQRIIRQLLTESVVMALLGGSLGVLLSVWGIHAVAQALPEELPVFFAPGINAPVIGFGILISVLAGLTFGVAPAMQAIGGDLKAPLMEGGRGGTASKKKKRVRQLFVIIEFAVALTVLMGAALLTDVFQRRLNIDPGFDPSNLLTLELTLPEHRYGEPWALVDFADELQRTLARLPGTSTQAITSTLPRTRNIAYSRFTIDGDLIEENQQPETTWLTVSPEYFSTLSIGIPMGRAITRSDRDDATPVIMVNRRMVDLHFGGDNPVGRRITIAGESREIVGVAENIAQQRLTGLMPDFPSIYFPLAQRPVRRLRVVLRSEGDAYQLAIPVQEAVWSVDPEQPVTAIRTMDEHMASELAGPNVLAQILLIIGLLALSLSAIGVYGVLAYAVTQQTSEIGIRMALGARRGNVVAGIAGQGATLAGLGLLAGAPLSGAVMLAISGVLSRGASADGIGDVQVLMIGPLASVAAILVAVALLASYLPARRALTIDPVTALQRE